MATTKKGQSSLVILTLWQVWKERNRRIFQHQQNDVMGMVAIIKEEARAWIISGANFLAAYLPTGDVALS